MLIYTLSLIILQNLLNDIQIFIASIIYHLIFLLIIAKNITAECFLADIKNFNRKYDHLRQ